MGKREKSHGKLEILSTENQNTIYNNVCIATNSVWRNIYNHKCLCYKK